LSWSVTASGGSFLWRRPGRGALHLDQGIVVTSHARQGKTVAQVIVSVPVESFSQANEAQFYVSMSRARKAIHLFTDSKVALHLSSLHPKAAKTAVKADSAIALEGDAPPHRNFGFWA
jgi:RNA helicase